MAKNISLLGADYPDVPAVTLPQTGGGTATFYDVEVTDGDPTLAWGTRSKVGTVQGTDLHVTMPANPDTWRPVQDNLNSQSTTDALSANQGKVLKGLVDAKLYSKAITTGAGVTSITIQTDTADAPYLIVWQTGGGIGAAICARTGKVILNLSSVYTITSMITSGNNMTLSATGFASARIWVASGNPIHSLTAA